ncbi:hypothetical protein [Mycobacteroides chelonae]|uniref:hypothetical protein n=1 Tax=Mycobacteroides chelonae TaxID=1774 RepID=UPI000F4DEA00|nr:hypothetical protein [Mycobacteroides chelonae]
MTSPGGRKLLEGRSGDPRKIVAVVRDGVCDVEQFLSALPDRAKAQFKARFERYCQVGHLRSPDEWRRLQADDERPLVYELKISHGPGYRLFGIVEGRVFVATHGVKKPKESDLKRHAKKAREVFQRNVAGER